MAKRFVKLRDPVTIELDGETIPAERGEPLAFSLIAADKLALARSPKMHRPHGPTCLRGGCDGCLARVSGEPNTMTCLVPCQGGERIETQNVLGSRKFDLLQATDWFFPHGMDHHHLLAGVPGLSPVMQGMARRIAGLGRLPSQPLQGEPALRREVDVLIVGAGAAGLTVAARLLDAGREVIVVDDAPVPGGSLRALGLSTSFLEAAKGAEILSSTTVAGIYEGESLAMTKTRASLLRPRVTVLATGAHDGVLTFPNNDLPGVVSARAAALLAAHGIAIGSRIALVGEGPYGRALRSMLAEVAEIVAVPLEADLRALGRSRVRGLVVGEERHAVDAIVVEAKGAPSFELAAQAGAEIALDLERGGYLPRTDGGGRAAPGVYVAGEAVGVGAELRAIVEQAEAVAAAIVAD